MDLNGDSGDDTFVVRSFAALVIDETGNVTNSSNTESINLGGGDDTDYFEIEEALEEEDEEDEFSSKSEDPEYVVNSLVDIDGGTGTGSYSLICSSCACLSSRITVLIVPCHLL